MGSIMTRMLMASLAQHAQGQSGQQGASSNGTPSGSAVPIPVQAAMGGLLGGMNLFGPNVRASGSGGSGSGGGPQGNRDTEATAAAVQVEAGRWAGLGYRQGSAVRWRPNLRRPRRGWQGSSKESVGFVKSRDDKSGAVTVSFPRKPTVTAEPGELVVDEEAERIRPGILVHVRQQVEQPAYGWGNVDNKTVGMVRDINPDGACVRRPFSSPGVELSWCLLSRVSLFLCAMYSSFGVTHILPFWHCCLYSTNPPIIQSTLTSTTKPLGEVEVDFVEAPGGWRCLLTELEPIPTDAAEATRRELRLEATVGLYAFPIGSAVRVKPSVYVYHSKGNRQPACYLLARLRCPIVYWFFGHSQCD